MKTSLSKWSTRRNILLASIWLTVIITGFLTLIAIVGSMEGLIVFGRVHSFAVRLGLVYTTVHMFRHRAQITSCFGVMICGSKQAVGIKGQSPINNRIMKITISIAFHIILHMISIHLAVAYTVFHIIQHRQNILPLLRKLLLGHYIKNSRTLLLAQVVT